MGKYNVEIKHIRNNSPSIISNASESFREDVQLEYATKYIFMCWKEHNKFHIKENDKYVKQKSKGG